MRVRETVTVHYNEYTEVCREVLSTVLWHFAYSGSLISNSIGDGGRLGDCQNRPEKDMVGF